MEQATNLYRQIHPSWIQNNRVTSQAFRPTPKDDKKLSVYNGDMYNAQESFEHYTKTNNLPSDGVLSVTVFEATDNTNLTCSEDNELFQGHALINYGDLETNGQIERVSKKLTTTAFTKGWAFKP